MLVSAVFRPFRLSLLTGAFVASVFACAGGERPALDMAPVPGDGDPGLEGGTGSDTDEDGGPGGSARPRPLPAVPLHTQSRWILDSKDQRFKLASVNWYGAESRDFVVAGLDRAPLATIAEQIRLAGFNSVRLPWSNELVETNPVVAPERLSANPGLVGKKGLDVLDAVIDALAFEGLVVVLDNHVSKAEWCCTETDGNGLWFTPDYPESKWLDDWRTMARRYVNQPAVVGADLRNEVRGMPDGRQPHWASAGADAALDWRAAAKRGGDAILEENPKLLVVVEGLNYAADLTGAYTNPISLAVANRLVWSAHDYGFFHDGLASYADLKTELGNKWGFLLGQGQPYTAPVWVAELGIEHQPAKISSIWFEGIRTYLDEADIDWAYWSVNGTQATGTTRTFGAEETYGFLDMTWTKPASPELTSALQAIMPVKQKP
jgi:endoglucanase